MASKTTSLNFATAKQSLWAPGTASSFRISTEDLLIYSSGEKTYDFNLDIGVAGASAQAYASLRVGLEAYAELVDSGHFNAAYQIDVLVDHAAAIDTTVTNDVTFTFSNGIVRSASIDSVGFSGSPGAGLDFVVDVNAGLRNIEWFAFGFTGSRPNITLIDIEERIPIVEVKVTAEFTAQLYAGIEITARLPTGADTSGRSTSSFVSASGFSKTKFLELNVDIDEVLIELAGKIPKIGKIIQKIGEVIFFDEEYDLGNYVTILPQGKIVLSATVLDFDANAGTVLTESVSLDIGKKTGPAAQIGTPDVGVVLRSDNGTPFDFTDDRIVRTKLGSAAAVQAISDATIAQLGGVATATVTAYYDIAKATYKHSVGIGIDARLTIRGLAAELGGDWVSSDLAFQFGPLIDVTFPEGGFQAKLFDFYNDRFDLKTGTYSNIRNGSDPGSWGYTAGAFNRVTDTYQVFATNTAPPNWNPEDPAAVQLAYAYGQALQKNNAALLATTGDLMAGTQQINLAAGLTTNNQNNKSFIWAGDKTSQIQTTSGNGSNHVVIALLPSSQTQVSPFNLKANIINGTSFNTQKLIANDVWVASSYTDKLALLDALPATMTNKIAQYSYGSSVLKSTIGVDIRGGELGDMLVRFGNQTKFFDGGDSAGDPNDIFMANFLATDPNTAISFSTRGGQGANGFSIAGVTIKDVEGFILRTGNADDFMTGGTTFDWFETSGGKDFVVLASDSVTDVAGTGDGDDVILVEFNDVTTLFNPGVDADAVYGGRGTDLAVFQSMEIDTQGRASDLLLTVTAQSLGSIQVSASSSIAALVTAIDYFDAGGYNVGDVLTERDVLTASKAAIRAGSGIASSISQFRYDSDFGAAIFASDVERVSVIASSASNDVVLFANGLTYDGGDGTVTVAGQTTNRLDTLIGDFGAYAARNGLTTGLTLVAEDRLGSTDPIRTWSFGEATIRGFERYVVEGTARSDNFLGGRYSDWLSGGDGDDVIDGGEFDSGTVTALGIATTERDELFGGAGNDLMFWSADGDDLIDGGEGDDTLVVASEEGKLTGIEYGFYDASGTRLTFTSQSSGFDIVAGLGLNRDATVGQTPVDRTIHVGDGAVDDPSSFMTYRNIEYVNVRGANDRSDLVFYQGGATYLGGEDASDSTIDTFAADWSGQVIAVNLAFGDANDGGTMLSNGVLVGGFERGVILAGSGNDRLRGGVADDYLDGGAGADVLYGAEGNDVLRGGAGDDLVFWDGLGEDSVRGGEGADHLVVGGRNSNLAWFFQDAGGTNLTNGIVGASSSTAEISQALANFKQAAEFQIFTNGTRVIYSEFEHVEIAGTDAANDLAFYQHGLVTIGGEQVGDADLFAADLSDERVNFTFIASDTQGASMVPGAGSGLFDDNGEFQGSSGGLRDIGNGDLVGGFERFNILLGSGDDFVLGGILQDRIVGGAGNDILDSGTGGTAEDRDIVVGGDGDDVLTFRGGFADYDGSNQGDDYDTLTLDIAPAQLRFAILDGGGAQIGSTYVAGSGAGTTTTRADFNAFFAANPSFAAGLRYDFEGGSLIYRNIEEIQVSGSASADFLVATLRQGVLVGNGGDDTLVSSLGTDVFLGGAGFDTYAFTTGDGVDVIAGETVGGARIYFNGLARSQVAFSVVNGDDLVIDAVSGTITVLDYFAGGGNGLNFVFDFTDQVGTINLSGLSGIAPGGVAVQGLTITGTSGDDDFSASFSNNADTYKGGAGDDYMEGSAGADVYDGSSGSDVVSFFENGDANGVSVDLGESRGFRGIAAGDLFIGIEHLGGTDFSDFLGGDGADNMLFGNGGDDSLFGGDGDDDLIGNRGRDTLTGGNGGDRLFGDEDDDSLSGEAGDDYLDGGRGKDALSGGSGKDILRGRQGDDTATGGSGEDTYLYGGDDDLATAVAGGAGNENGKDDFDGGDDYDIVDLSLSEYAVTMTLGAGGAGSVSTRFNGAIPSAQPAVTIVTFSNSEQVTGSRFDDVLVSGAFGGQFDGGAGDDVFFGAAGAQTFVGGTGSDSLRYDVEGGSGGITVNLSGAVGSITDTFGDTDSVVGVEVIHGTNFDDAFTGSDLDDTFFDGDGNDTVDLRGGNDRVIAGKNGVDGVNDVYDGGTGFDTVDFSQLLGTLNTSSNIRYGVTLNLGGSGSTGSVYDPINANNVNPVLNFEGAVGTAFIDFIVGTDGVNVIEAGAGDDEVYGRRGADVIVAGSGNDKYFGGEGFFDFTDTFDDTLDYSKLTGVMLDRTTGVAVKSGAGTDQFSGFEKFIASAGNDDFTGHRLVADEFFYVGAAGTGGFDLWNGAGDGGSDDLVVDTANFSFYGAAIRVDLEASVEVTTRDAVNLDPAAGALRNMVDLTNFESVVVTEFADEYLGTSGADRLEGRGGNDFLTGRAGDDILRGDEGYDTVDYSKETGANGIVVDLTGRLVLTFVGGTDTFGDADRFDSIENVIGTDRADVIIGGAGPHVFDGRGGADTIAVAAGDNLLIGGAGTDTLTGGTGKDMIEGGNDDDVIDAGGGDDLVQGGAGNDTIVGGLGKDTISYAGARSAVTFNLTTTGQQNTRGAGLDTVREFENVTGSAFGDVLTGDGGANVLSGGAGSDTLDGQAGADTMIGGAGNDSYVVDNAGDIVREESVTGTDDGGSDTVRASVSFLLGDFVENLTLTGNDDVNGTGNALNNTIVGNAGANQIDGGGGGDRLLGGAGNDVYIIRGAGAAVIEFANEGTDTVRAVGNYTLSANVENLVLTGPTGNGTGNALNNTLTGNAGNNVLDGKGGADTMIGGLGNDTYVVDNPGDAINELAGQGNDTVRALINYTMVDNLERLELTSVSNISGTGNGLANTIVGGTGANTLTGLGGKDTLTGGTGRDTFVFTSLSDSTVATTGRDTITDFSRSDGERIDLRQIDAIAGGTTNDAFAFIGTNAFSGAAGQLRYQASGNDTLVSGDVDGNSVADFAILLTGQIALTSGNFLL